MHSSSSHCKYPDCTSCFLVPECVWCTRNECNTPYSIEYHGTWHCNLVVMSQVVRSISLHDSYLQATHRNRTIHIYHWKARTQTQSGCKISTQVTTNTSSRLFAYANLHKSRLLLDLSSKTVLTARRGTNTQTTTNSTKTSTIDINLSDQKLQGTTLDYNYNSTQTQFFALVDRHGNWLQSTSSYGLLYLVLRYKDVYDK